MKTNYIIQTLVILFFVLTASAQQGINYKAIINDANGDVLANSQVTIQFTILENGITNVYKESHNTTTDVNGIIIVNIGEGTLINGDFNSIDWGSNPLFLKTEIDIGDGLIDMGTTEFKTVPYAFYAENGPGDDDADPANELIMNVVLNGTDLEITDAGGTNSVDLSSLSGETSTTYSIGLDNTVGGYIFYVTPNGKHGLVACTTELGSTNNYYGACAGCNDPLLLNFEAQNFMDWRLPNSWELSHMYQHKDDIGGFNSSTYWSSTEILEDKFMIMNFDTGVNDISLKTESHYTRPVRAF